MLNQLFRANFPDAVERERAVAAYIAATGLPGQLQDSVNYFSNRFFLQKQLRGSVALKTARTTLIGSLFSTRRNALSVQANDSALLGSATSALNDDTKQVGASVSLNYRITSHSTLQVSQFNSNSESLTTGLKTSNRLSSVSLSHTLARKLTGVVELRRNSGNTGFAPSGLPLGATGNYRENALSASLNLQL